MRGSARSHSLGWVVCVCVWSKDYMTFCEIDWYFGVNATPPTWTSLLVGIGFGGFDELLLLSLYGITMENSASIYIN